MIYTAYGKECRLNLNMIFTDNYELRAEYKEGSEWKYIAAPSFYGSTLNTKEKTDEYYQKALDEVNSAMEKMPGGVSEPENGTDRIQWLIDNKTIVENNKLKIG